MAEQHKIEVPCLIASEEGSESDVAALTSVPTSQFPRFVKVVASAAAVAGALVVCAVFAGQANVPKMSSASAHLVTQLAYTGTCAGSTNAERCSNYCQDALSYVLNGGTSTPCTLSAGGFGSSSIDISCNNGVATTCNIQTSEPSSSAACFPGQAVVRVDARGEVPISELAVGDQVLVEATQGAFVYEPVLSFLHVAAKGLESDFLVVDHARGQLRVSAKHLVFVETAGGVRTEKLATDLQPGDELLVVLGGGGGTARSPVMSSRRDIGTSGMYAPLTPSGTVVVDGVVASNFANVAVHGAAQAFFFFVRAYHRLNVASLLPWSSAAAAASSEVMDDVHPWAAILHNGYFKLDELLVIS